MPAKKVGLRSELHFIQLSNAHDLSYDAGTMRGNAVPAFVFPAGGLRNSAHLFSIEIVRRF